MGELMRRPGVTSMTYNRCWVESGGIKVDQAKRLKDLESENARPK